MLRIRLRPGLLVVLLSVIFAQACAPQLTSTPFRPPTQILPTQILSTITPIPTNTSVPTTTITPTVTGPCTNNLTFIEDVTIPDDTTVPAGSSMDKQWLVTNSGTCNWDSTYHLRWTGGETFGASEEQALFPARAGTQATLRILFTAPTVEGIYQSAWQAFGPDGTAFGDAVFITVNVSPP
jgi:hypothetical protein